MVQINIEMNPNNKFNSNNNNKESNQKQIKTIILMYV